MDQNWLCFSMTAVFLCGNLNEMLTLPGLVSYAAQSSHGSLPLITVIA